ncbi:hypothetical protein I4U23_002628 [Adineta vaga]|nr:hypothetical protein I4U23_002628 [Adineta vaga]
MTQENTLNRRTQNTNLYPEVWVEEIVKRLSNKSQKTNNKQIPVKRQEADVIDKANPLTEVNILQNVRKRTFSHWPQHASPSSAQMIDAGFFNCNVGDRVICIYCNLICQQWIPYTDDPCEVHKTLSPKCPYVIAKEKRRQAASIRIMNDQATRDNMDGVMNNDPFRCNEMVCTYPCHPAYANITDRDASFVTWPNENQPSMDDLVQAGFFYTGTKTIVTCFYCNGSLEDVLPTENPMIEHARWFPNCAYAKQLCDTELYKKVQESKNAQHDTTESDDFDWRIQTINSSIDRKQMIIPDEETLFKLVNDRLDLPFSQYLLCQNFKLSIIKRCYEDQLRLKHADFVSDSDLLLACVISQKQIDYIKQEKRTIIVPSVAMNQIHTNQHLEAILDRTSSDKAEQHYFNNKYVPIIPNANFHS